MVEVPVVLVAVVELVLVAVVELVLVATVEVVLVAVVEVVLVCELLLAPHPANASVAAPSARTTCRRGRTRAGWRSVTRERPWLRRAGDAGRPGSIPDDKTCLSSPTMTGAPNSPREHLIAPSSCPRCKGL